MKWGRSFCGRKMIRLGAGEWLTSDAIWRIAQGETVEISEAGEQKMRRAQVALRKLMHRETKVYGMHSGFGPLAVERVESKQAATVQRNLIYHLCSGSGPLLSACHSRALMAARVHCVAQGFSAVRRSTLEFPIQFLNHDILPEIPSRGTVGASGDLTPLAHMARTFLGEGRVRYQGESIEAKRGLELVGLQPFRPMPNEGLSLVNGTSVMTGIAAVNHVLARRAIYLGLRLGLMYAECMEARSEAYEAIVAEIRRHPGQEQAVSLLWDWLQSSKNLIGPNRTRKKRNWGRTESEAALPQDAYSMRCLPQLLGAALDSLEFHARIVDREINSVTDNPILLADEGRVVHAGNFNGQHVSFASDALSNAIVQVAVLAERQMARITDVTLSRGLPPFLQAKRVGLQSGFMGVQVASTALVAEMRTMAMPASIQSIATNANNQDVVSMGTIAARKAGAQIEICFQVLSQLAAALAQAMDLRGLPGFSDSSIAVYEVVRKRMARLEEDRALGPEIEMLTEDLIKTSWESEIGPPLRASRRAGLNSKDNSFYGSPSPTQKPGVSSMASQNSFFRAKAQPTTKRTSIL